MTPFCLTHTLPALRWCDCTRPQPATAYGFTYCGRCWRGHKPKKEGE